ncbi:MAG: hypothetical protein Kow0099_22630 [Candidatus Abyssubacteria bacterium]
MGAEITDVTDGIMTVKVTGRLTESELVGVQKRATEIIRAQGKTRILVVVEQFDGWQRGGQWNDFSFQEQADPYIEKMAIVGEQQWRDLALVFTTESMRPFPIKYFPPDETAKARAWLGGEEG